MNYTTVYVGMDVHKENFSLCCYTNEKELLRDVLFSQNLRYAAGSHSTVSSMASTCSPCAANHGAFGSAQATMPLFFP